MCLSAKHLMYFVISTDFVMHVFNANMICCASMPSQCRMVKHAEIHNDLMITVGSDGLVILQLRIKQDHDPKIAVQLDPRGHAVEVEIKARFELGTTYLNSWLRGFHFTPKQS